MGESYDAGIFIKVTIKGKRPMHIEPFHGGKTGTIYKTKEMITVCPKNPEGIINILVCDFLQNGRFLSTDRCCNTNGKAVTAQRFVSHS